MKRVLVVVLMGLGAATGAAFDRPQRSYHVDVCAESDDAVQQAAVP